MTRITFVSHDGTAETIEAEVGQSVMDAAKHHGVRGIEAVCGGGCACATCHVLVDAEWLARLLPATPEEQDLIDFLNQKQPNSRLSCQIALRPDLDGLVLHLPEHQE
jgi:2Fe-2S ferredoxin